MEWLRINFINWFNSLNARKYFLKHHSAPVKSLPKSYNALKNNEHSILNWFILIKLYLKICELFQKTYLGFDFFHHVEYMFYSSWLSQIRCQSEQMCRDIILSSKHNYLYSHLDSSLNIIWSRICIYWTKTKKKKTNKQTWSRINIMGRFLK